MKLRRLMLMPALILSLGFLVACTNASSSTPLQLTVAQLSQYDGKNGARAYVAYNGNIYDVTNHPEWNNGMHNGVTAGVDITLIFPHPVSYLNNVPVVGTLVTN